MSVVVEVETRGALGRLALAALVSTVCLMGACDSKSASPVPAEDVVEAIDAVVDVDEPDAVEVDADDAEDVPEDTGPPPECGPGSTSPLPDPCNDYDACTTDTCEDGRCVRTEVPECCKSDDQCDDGIACTDDRCNRIRSTCESVRGDSFCCVTTSDCEDLDACTENVCAANRCVYPVKPSCPVNNPALCNDQNDCTSDQWGADGVCVYTALDSSESNCCADAAACDDGDAATVDQCQNARCWHGAAGCAADLDCAGPNLCSTSNYVDNSCVYPEASACCETDAECDDDLGDTADRCVDNRCVHALIERRCTEAAECPGSNPCIMQSCVSGYCSATVNDVEGCCTKSADCGTPERCQDVACGDFQCAVSATTEARAFWSADFSTLEGWAVVADASGARWQTRGVQYISAPLSLYYGTTAGGFDVGRTRGTITSPVITLPSGTPSESLSVSLWRNLLVESISSRDLITLEVIPDGGTPALIWDKSYDSGPGLAWRLDTVALPSGIVGQIQLRFSFDTIDGIDNVGQGAFIDDLSILAPCPE